jgi:hypothetical protein
MKLFAYLSTLFSVPQSVYYLDIIQEPSNQLELRRQWEKNDENGRVSLVSHWVICKKRRTSIKSESKK